MSVSVTNPLIAQAPQLEMGELFPMTTILNKSRSEPDWIIPGLLKRQNTMFMIGAPKVGKSWLLLNLAWDLAEGKPIWGIDRKRDGAVFAPPYPMRVLYFAQEDVTDDVQDRLILMRDGGRVPNDNLLFRPKDLSLVLDSQEGKLRIGSLIAAAQPDLVIFDPFRRMLLGDENSSAVTAALWRQLDEWGRKYNCSFVFSHHVVKPSKDKGYDQTSPFAGRGSGDLYGGGDAFVNVMPQPLRTRMQHTHKLDLYFETKRGAPICPVRVSLPLPPGVVVFDDFLLGQGAAK